MKKKFFSAMLLVAAFGMTSCSDEIVVDAGSSPEDSGKYAYINAAISFPSSGYTRSQTEGDEDGNHKDDTNSNATPDSETAYDYESDVRSMILVIANENDEYLTHTVVPSIAPVGGKTNPTYMVNSKIPYDVLEKAYTKNGVLGKLQGEELGKAEIKVNLYAYCNYTSDILSKFDDYAADQASDSPADETSTEWINWSGYVEEDLKEAGKPKPTITNTIWAQRSFLMTNYENYQSNKFPKNIEGWDDFSNQDKALDLTGGTETAPIPLKVERVAARFDFKDGSIKQEVVDGEIKQVGTGNNNNTYQLWTTIKTTKNGGTILEPALEPDDDPSAVDDDDDDDDDATQSGGGTTTTTEIKNLFSVKLTRMALVNMSKNFYYLRRVSDDGMPKKVDSQDDQKITNGWKVGGYEYWKRVLKPGTDADPEYTYEYNYVVDTDANAKQTVKGIQPGDNNAGKHFNFCLYDGTPDANDNYPYARDKWYADNITDVLSDAKNPNKDQWNNESNYHIWRYVTENTIPQSEDTAHPESQQKTIQSTGIVFKGAIIAGEHLDASNFSDDVKKALNVAAGKVEGVNKDEYDYPVLYSFDNVLYAGMVELIESAYNEGENSPFYQAVDNILTKHWAYKKDGDKVTYTFSEGEIDVDVDEDTDDDYLTVTRCYGILHQTDDEFKEDYQGYSLDFVLSENANDYEPGGAGYVKEVEQKFCKLVPKQNITVYEATNEEDGEGWGYYCYYFYWNRHNDNEKSGKMGPMEFAVVRNNVYKLAVKSINQLGHPRDTTHDPEPITPETPDEDPTRYIKVQVEVLPWVVRVNDIEF